jgi:hypothetical protein
MGWLVVDYASADSSQPATRVRSCRRVPQSRGRSTGEVSQDNHTFSRNLAVIGVRLRDDAYMTWVAAEVESGNALRAWFNSRKL